MKASVGFIFFMLFLAGIALINLRGMSDRADTSVESSAELAEHAWRPTHLGEMRLPEDTEMYIQFETDGQVTGHGGCNRFFGTYELKEGGIRIGPVGATMMACPDPANSFEFSFFQALESTTSVARAEDRLALRDARGVTVARFSAMERQASPE